MRPPFWLILAIVIFPHPIPSLTADAARVGTEYHFVPHSEAGQDATTPEWVKTDRGWIKPDWLTAKPQPWKLARLHPLVVASMLVTLALGIYTIHPE